MGDNMSDIDSLRSEESYKRSEKSNYESQKSRVEDRIARLEYVKTVVSSVKDDVSELSSSIKKKPESYVDHWGGDHYTWISTFTENEIGLNYDKYISNVDYILDSLCDEITRLRNESRNLGSIINSIANSIDNIINEIEKFFN